jgi:hypothetical protein
MNGSLRALKQENDNLKRQGTMTQDIQVRINNYDLRVHQLENENQ